MKLIEALVLLVVLLGLARGLFRVGPQGSLGLVLRMGRFRREAHPGLVVKAPLLDSLQLVHQVCHGQFGTRTRHHGRQRLPSH
ncbi:hypothetical protein [Sulfobacillus harzensis]|uniref:Uncharacterized protein n=1 Tax=Sulfobacillus harzensis TaxID=2729629 RepID=A0A7Y0Q1T8_9FIRM|nr:hypothetical protein [Sulfobacillus harzensis]NMP21782.1 hypothetical protein [Sulfobacillus harzensis]